MRIRVSSLLPLLLVLLLAALTLWLRSAAETPGGGEPGRLRHDPDAIVEKFTMTRLDERGSAQQSLSAQRMVHFGDDDSTELDAPRLIRRGDGPAITITADRGTLTGDGEEAFFRGNVLVVREAGAAQQELRMRTNALHVLVEKNLVHTDEQVTITEGRSVLSGVGMELDKQSRRFTLLSQVRGRFDQARK